MEAVAYLRVSGLGQVEGTGLDRQQEAIEGYAREQGIRLVGIYQEYGVSGTVGGLDRPAFKLLLNDLLQNGVRTIIVEGMDRLARELQVQETLITYLLSKGITLISARTGENITEAASSDPMRKALVQMQGVFAELEKSMLVEKLRKARIKTREMVGRCEGAKPFGETGDEQQIVKQVLLLRKRGNTLTAIANQLNDQGIVTKRGNSWHPTQVSRLIQMYG